MLFHKKNIIRVMIVIIYKWICEIEKIKKNYVSIYIMDIENSS